MRQLGFWRPILLGGCALFVALVLAGPASAERTYESQFTEANGTPFSNPYGIAIDGSDNLWVADVGPGLIDKFAPDGTLLKQGNGEGHWSGAYTRSVAYSNASGQVYVADSNFDDLWILDSDAKFVSEIPPPWGNGCCFVYTAADNSSGATGGDVYLSGQGNGVYRFDEGGASASYSPSIPVPYIEGNRLTGTPGGSFADLTGLATDFEGRLLVISSTTVHEFAPSGDFLRSFTEANGLSFSSISAVASDPTNGNILIAGTAGENAIFEFGPAGEYLDKTTEANGAPIGYIQGMTLDSSGMLYASDASNRVIDIFTSAVKTPKVIYGALTNPGHTTATLHATVDPNEGGDVVDCKFEYGTNSSYSLGNVPCTPDPASNPPTSHFGAPTEVSTELTGLTAETTYHYRVVAANAQPHGQIKGRDQTFIPEAVLGVTTKPATDVAASSLTFNGSYTGEGIETQHYFEYGATTAYGHSTPVIDGGVQTGPQEVSGKATDLQSHFIYHFRLVATNSFGTTHGQDEIASETPAPPSVDGTSSSNLTPTTADLNAQINPQGFDTTYHFEYGVTPDYGANAPAPDADIGAASTNQSVTVHLTGLQVHFTYHFRLVATNKWGTTTTEDQSFNFYPPNCPNENVRQQVQANYLPDCRAYEIVSPGDTGGTQLYPGGPNTGRASSPPRFAFVGLWGEIPHSGKPINSSGDLYVATRTSTGWVSKYVGIPSNQAAVAGGPPEGLPNSAIEPPDIYTTQSFGGTPVTKIQNSVLTDPSMNTFLDWNDGSQATGANFGSTGDFGNPTPMASNAPYVWRADGSALGRWPTNLAGVPPGVHTHRDLAGNTTNIQLGGVHALDCPPVTEIGPNGQLVYNHCAGDVTASGDLSHFVFASKWNQFTPDGTLTPPGSVYDNNTATGSVVVASKTVDGDPIPSEPGDHSGEPLQIPGVSLDGSHILIAAGATGPCGEATCPDPPCPSEVSIRCPMQPSHLYMRVDAAITFDVSQGHAVKYAGMTTDGRKVYFTSATKLAPSDQDTSTDLYMWSEATDALTVLSLGDSGTGNSDNCSAAYTLRCGVMTFTSRQRSCGEPGALGGSCRSDNAIASESGDIFFFSPEQLDGSRGVPDQRNLYVYRNGSNQYVATFTTGPFCSYSLYGLCTNSPLARIQVSPDGSHMAFLTASPVTNYENAGYLEMFTYDPSTRKVQCVSCIPSADPPTSNVLASQNGLFMSDDGRAFFSTEDALVHADTNKGVDVYEYVDGRPQLITPGTGETAKPTEAVENVPGLVGVSGDGIDVFFSTYNTLVPQDHNGLFLKFYDARSGGGISAPPAPPPCEAADECHGAASLPPTAQRDATSAELPRGNVSSTARRKKHHHKKRRNRGDRHKTSDRRPKADHGSEGSR